MSTEKRKYYTVSYKRQLYRFEFDYVDLGTDGWRAYIVRTPCYGSRDTGAGVIHRLTAPDGRKYVCWNCAVETEEDMDAIVALWSRANTMYIVDDILVDTAVSLIQAS